VPDAVARPSDPPPARPWIPWADSWRAIWMLVVALGLLRLLYLLLLCPYDLVQDEAHYWEWSRRLDWSYYSKGPGVAWLIAATTSLLGDTEAGVRLGAVLASAVASLGIAALAVRASGDRRAGFVAAALFNLTPVYQVSGILMTIDIPYLACWSLAALAARGALFRDRAASWLLVALALGVGFLFKYTALLLLPGLIGFVLLDRRARAAVRNHWPWIMGAIPVLLLALVPVLVWNANHDWSTVRHLLGHLRLAGGDMPSSRSGGGWAYEPKWTLEFLGSQAALLGPVLPALVAACLWAWGSRHEEGEGPRARRFLLWLGLPVLAIYTAVTLFTDAEGNWPIATYVTLTSLAGWDLVRRMDRHRARAAAWRTLPEGERPRSGLFRRRPESAGRVLMRIALIGGVVVQIVLLRLDIVGGAVDAAARGVSGWLAERGMIDEPIERLVPLHRVTQGGLLAEPVQRVLEDIRADASLGEPFIVANKYGHASLLAFYLPGKPTVYCAAAYQGGRKNQYDFWKETDLSDLDALEGRPAVLLGAAPEQWAGAFARTQRAGIVRMHAEKAFNLLIGTGYKGFPEMRDRP